MNIFCVYSGSYISMYSDCLDLNRWYHGKSGYIAIIRLTKVLKRRRIYDIFMSCCFFFIQSKYFLHWKMTVLYSYQQGKVKKVLENYTQNFTAPTERFDCHVSEQLPSVSANTSSFLAFERTQVRRDKIIQCSFFPQSSPTFM